MIGWKYKYKEGIGILLTLTHSQFVRQAPHADQLTQSRHLAGSFQTRLIFSSALQQKAGLFEGSGRRDSSRYGMVSGGIGVQKYVPPARVTGARRVRSMQGLLGFLSAWGIGPCMCLYGSQWSS